MPAILQFLLSGSHTETAQGGFETYEAPLPPCGLCTSVPSDKG